MAEKKPIFVSSSGGFQQSQTGDYVGTSHGGTGQTTFTDGQLLIGNTSGGLTKSTLTGSSNSITVTNGNGSITIAIADNPVLTGTGALTVPVGTAAQQPGSPVNGMIRYNSTNAAFEVYQDSAWVPMTSSGIVKYYSASATSGQTVVNLPWSYSVGANQLLVFIQGVKQLAGTAYTETSSTSITFSPGLTLNNTIEIFKVASATTATINLNEILSASGANTLTNDDYAQEWNWTLTTASKSAFKFGEDSAATNGAGAQFLVDIGTLAGSTANPLRIQAQEDNIVNVTPSGQIRVGESSSNNFRAVSYASTSFSIAGDAQSCQYIARATTTDSSQTELFLDGAAASQRMALPSDSTWFFEIKIAARRTDADNESAGYKYEGVIDNNGGTVALVGSTIETIVAEDQTAWSVSIDADDTNNSLRIRVTGENSKTIRWVAYIKTVEVTG